MHILKTGHLNLLDGSGYPSNLETARSFQIVHEINTDYIVMQFGKVNKDVYTCDDFKELWKPNEIKGCFN